MRIAAISLQRSIELYDLDFLFSGVSDKRIEKAKSFYYVQDAYRTVLGEILIRYLIILTTNITNPDIILNITSEGKLIIKSPHNMHCTISHAGDWILSAISYNIIGIDVEAMSNAKLDIATHFFSDAEKEWVNKFDILENKKNFLKIWTLKESYLKAIGIGLALPLKSFSFSILQNDTIDMENSFDLTHYFFKNYPLDKDHIASACSTIDNLPNSIDVVKIEDIIPRIT